MVQHFFDYDSHGWLDPDMNKDLTDEELMRMFFVRIVALLVLIAIIGIVCVVIHLVHSA